MEKLKQYNIVLALLQSDDLSSLGEDNVIQKRLWIKSK